MKLHELTEGLIRSIPEKDLIKFLKKNPKFRIVSTSEVQKYNDSLKFRGLLRVEYESPADLKELEKFIRPFGWFVAKYAHKWEDSEDYNPGEEEYSEPGDEYDEVKQAFKPMAVLQPKYDDEIEELPEFLYHVTSAEKAHKIDKIGLTPRQGGNRRAAHPERVYVATTLKDLDVISHEFKVDHYAGGKKAEPKFVKYRIHTNKLPKKIKFMSDPVFWPTGFYTTSNIPPEALEQIF